MDEMNKEKDMDTQEPSQEESLVKEPDFVQDCEAGENTNTVLESSRQAESGIEETVSEDNSQEQESQPVKPGFAPTKRNLMLWLLCGFYLAYNGYQLVKGYVVKEEGTSWIFLLCGIAFIGIGIFLVISSYRLVNKMDQAKKDKEDPEGEGALENQEGAGQEGSSSGSFLGGLFGFSQGKPGKEQEAVKGPSIAERANLARDLGDVNESEGDTDGGN